MSRLALALGLSVSAAWAAAPTIVAGPTVQYVGDHFAGVKWRTSYTGNLTTTLSAGIDDSTESIPLTACDNFPEGAVLRIGREHMLSRSTATGACNLSVRRVYDADMLRVWEGTLTNIVVTGGNSCVATTPMPHLYETGDKLRVLRIAGGGISASTTFTVSSTTSTTISWTCTGSTNGTYSNKGLQIYKYPDSHSGGSSVMRIDADGKICITSPYTAEFRTPEENFSVLRQSVNHWVYAINLLANTTYTAHVVSTPRTGPANSNSTASSCSSPGADTVVSEDFEFTTLAEGSDDPAAPSTAGKTWSYQTGALSFATDELVASDCSDLQSKINAAAAADGNQNHRVRIPASSTCTGLYTLPPKSGSNASGSGLLVLTTSAHASLPEEGERVSAAEHASYMPLLRSSTDGQGVLRIMPSAHHWVVRGVQIDYDPAKAGGAPGDNDFVLVYSLNGDDSDYDITQDPHHIVLQQVIIAPQQYHNTVRGVRIHGDYLVVEGSDILAFGTNDQGAVQVDGADSQYIYIHNNKLQSPMSGYYQSDNGMNPQDTWVERNYITKPKSWNRWFPEWYSSASHSVSAATNAATVTFTTSTQNIIGQYASQPVLFSGGTGDWAALNVKTWSVGGGTLNVTVSSGVATATTSSAHGLSTGDRVVVAGGQDSPCAKDFNTAEYSVAITVTSTTTFTWDTDAGNFSTTSGNQCKGSNITVMGPVFVATRSSATQFTIPVNTSGWGAYTSGLSVSYGINRNSKNCFEFKTAIRAEVTGNIIENCWAQDQSGQATVMSVRGSDMFGGWPIMQGGPEYLWHAALTINDVSIHHNYVKDACVVASILGSNPNSPVTPLQRVRWAHNAGYVGRQAAGGGTCLGAMAGWNGSYNHVTLDHNTVISSVGRVVNEDYSSSFQFSARPRLTNNLATAYGNMGNGSCSWGGMAATANLACANYTWRTWELSRNVFYGDKAGADSADAFGYQRQHMGVTTGDSTGAEYQANFWPSTVAEVGLTGHRTVTAATNATPIVITTSAAHGCETGDQVWIADASGNTNANGRWRVEVVSSTTMKLIGSFGSGTFSGSASMFPLSGACATAEALRLAEGSNYRAGVSYSAAAFPPGVDSSAGAGDASDATDVGVDIDALLAVLDGSGDPPPPPPPSPPNRTVFEGRAVISGR